MFGGNLASLLRTKAGGARRKRSGSRKRTGSRKSGGGGILDNVVRTLGDRAQAAASPTAPAATAPMKGGKRTRRLRKRTGHAKRRSARAHSAGGRRRTRQRGGNKLSALSPASL
jgi:hypothetical protein